MPPAPAGPFPKEAARDLLGIARALYLTFKNMGPAYDKPRERVRHIGDRLARAIEKSEKIGDWSRSTAWMMAEEAAQELGELVDVYLPAKNLIAAAGERLRGKR